MPITPVNPNGDELYYILRKRLFEKMPPTSEIERVASDYRDALREANKMGLTTTAPESMYTRVVDSYPFHPDLRELVGKFKENDGFQQTRGVIRLMQMVVSNLWKSERAGMIDLIHPYDIDLNIDEVQVEQDRTTLVIVRPGGMANQLPISSDWLEWWEQQQYKNRVLFLSGSRDTYQKVLDAARQTRALQSIEDELRSEGTPSDDPQWRAHDALRDRIEPVRFANGRPSYV